jgi:hypothetical protein
MPSDTTAALRLSQVPRSLPTLDAWGSGDLRRIEARLRSSLQRLRETAAGLALRRLIQTVADRATFRPGSPGTALVEVSVGFVARGAGVGLNSARAAFGAFRSATVEFVLDERSAERCGWHLRPLLPGTRRGPLRTYPAETIAACRTLADELEGAGWVGGPLRSVWRSLPPEDLRAIGFERLPPGGKVRCPLHDDQDPSLVILGDPAKQCGAAYCHGGCGAAFWTRADDGSRWVRRARRPQDGTEPAIGSSIASHPESRRPPEGAGRLGTPRRVVRAPAGATVAGPEVERLLGDAEGHVAGDLGSAGLRRRWSRGVVEALAWADVAGPAAEARILAASSLVATGRSSAEVVAPARLLSVGAMRATAIELRRIPGVEPGVGLSLAVPVAFEPGQQGWALVDLDDLDPTIGWRGADAVALVGAVVAQDERCSGRVAVVETSPTGVQAWVELREPVADPRTWWRLPAVRTWYAQLSKAVLGAVRASGRSGGWVDATAAAAGRYGRRPGWRLVDGYVPFRARLLGLFEDGNVIAPREIRLRSRSAVDEDRDGDGEAEVSSRGRLHVLTADR